MKAKSKFKPKAKSSKCTLILLFFLLSVLHAQTDSTYVGGQEGVIARLTIPTSINLTGDYSAFLSDLIADFNITTYDEIFEGTESDKLKRYRYFVPHNLTDIPQLQNVLLSSVFFDVAEIVYTVKTLSSEFPSTLVECNNPDDYDDPATIMTNHFEYMEIPCAWSITHGNSDILVAVIDEFFDESHPDLANKFVDIKGNCNPVRDICNHGYAIAGGIGAIVDNGICVAGTGYNTRLIGYCAGLSDECGSLSGSAMLSSINTAIQDGVRVINISASGIGTFGQSARDLIEELVRNNINLVVGSYGEAHASYANEPGVINVGQITDGGWYAQYHPTDDELNVDIGASVINVGLLHSPHANPNLCEIRSGNSSLAAGFISGIIALILAENPCLSPDEIETILKQTSQPIGNAANHPNIGDAGGVNAYQAVLAASEKIPTSTITGDIVWEIPKRVDGMITIAPGAKLTIRSGAFFSEFAGIEVEPGGRLEVEGGHLRSDCDNPNGWYGIEVLGNPTLSQTPSSNQGVVVLDNALIEHARTGVSLFDRKTYSLGGGILLAENSRFLNCRSGVEIAKFFNRLPLSGLPLHNLSKIQNCRFELTDDFRFTTGRNHIFLDRVTRVNILNSQFTDSRTVLFKDTDSKLQDGVRITNAFLDMRGCTIAQMRYGLRSENIFNATSFTVSGNTFRDNFYGVSTRAVDAFTLTGNDFEVGDFVGNTQGFAFPDRPVGVFIDQCSRFTLKNNSFVGDAAQSSIETVGVAVNNTNMEVSGVFNSDNNAIQLNSFQNLYRANVANGRNAGPELNMGLTYLCNTNTTNECNDMTVFDGAIRTLQLAEPNSNAAGNTFTQDNACTPFSDIENGGIGIKYYFFPNSTDNREEPLFISAGVERITSVQNLCSDNSNGDEPDDPQDVPVLEEEYIDDLSGFIGDRDNYRQLLDGGNTAQLLQAIQNAGAGNLSAVRTQLLNTSPYLSKRVLKALRNNTVFSTQDKQLVHLANPSATLDVLPDILINEGIFSNLSNYQIYKDAYSPNTRQQTEEALVGKLTTLQYLSKSLEKHYLLADEVDWLKVAEWSAASLSMEGELRSLDAYLAADDLTKLSTGITQLSSVTDEEVVDYLDLKNLQLTLAQQDRELEALTSAEQLLVTNIATGKGKAAVQAQNWLTLLDSTLVYQEEPAWGNSLNISPLQAQPTATMPLNKVEVYPNPVEREVFFRYKLAEPIHIWTQPGTLRIFSVNGAEVYRTNLVDPIGTVSWQPAATGSRAGLYFYYLSDAEGRLLDQGKLIYQPNQD